MVCRTARRGFSLIELVIVVVIIGIIAAIAIPRMSRGAAGAADSALTANLAVLRNAIDLFQTEHGGTFPPAGKLVTALQDYSDDKAATFGAKSATEIFGPYLRVVPPLPVGSNKGLNTVTETGPAGTGAFGWFYTPASGAIVANLAGTEKDSAGKAYNAY
ncbi:MAG: prepilin-type N-terminal cleavage/methylation domain-containing protein [Phycisphaerales bacterium]|nr:prepilin-type N-terminal cleavage/methylation domain-containing protein [Phycisphaerales bacterium]